MYYYILDPYNIPQKNFERQQAELQNLLTEFNIGGEMARITPLRIMQDLVDTAASRGVKTLVACGTDQTFNQMLACVKDRDFTLAFIPFVPNTQLGHILGMTDLNTCVKTIAGRRTEKMDLAQINDSHFISYLELGIGKEINKPLGILGSIKLFSSGTTQIKMRIDDSYDFSAKMAGGLIINTRAAKHGIESIVGNPQDGYLDLLIIEKLSRVTAAKHKSDIQTGFYENIPGATMIRCQKIEFLEPLGYPVCVDGIEVAKIPATVTISPQKLKMIVGKARTF